MIMNPEYKALLIRNQCRKSKKNARAYQMMETVV